MAFSGSSYFAGVGTAFAAIALGFAGGALITTSAVQPPNRLERVNSGGTVGSNSSATHAATASTNAEQSGSTRPPAEQAPPQAAATASAAESQSAQQPQPAAPVAAKMDTKTETATNVQEQAASAPAVKASPPPIVAKSEDAAPAKNEVKNERTNARAADSNRQSSRRKAEDRRSWDDRRFSERRRRQDQDGRWQNQEQRQQSLDEASTAARPIRRDNTVDQIVERDEAPRFDAGPPHRFQLFEDDGPPRAINEPPPRFGLFGD